MWLDLDAPGPYGPADAAVTRRAERVCAILTADCLPVRFRDRFGDLMAAAHAGWRGLAAGVIEATVRAMGSRRSASSRGWDRLLGHSTSKSAPRCARRL